MDDNNDDADLGLIRASATLLSELESNLPRLLYRRSRSKQGLLIAHSHVRQKDLDHIVKLLEPFQGDSQLLDTHLKSIVPQIADALLQRLVANANPVKDGYIDLSFATSVLLYTLCKIRGRKVISGLLPNEPRYLELITSSLKTHLTTPDAWQVHFSLFLWLSHLLLTPFDLQTISYHNSNVELPASLNLKQDLPDLARRTLELCLQSLSASTVSQEVAALALVRLATRPDMLAQSLADDLVDFSLLANTSTQLHSRLGTLRFLAGIAKSADLAHLLPRVLEACDAMIVDEASAADALERKLVLKTMSTVIMTSLRAAPESALLSNFLDDSTALENTIDFLLQCLTDRESLVRNAAAKSISNILPLLNAAMAQEILEALFASLRAEMPAEIDGPHSPTANAMAWHGIVLSLSYALFKRSVPKAQLPELIRLLLMALAFEQRTAAGSSAGANVRDAANFGLWSLARRLTTAELLDLEMEESKHGSNTIVTIAAHLLQAACLDPAGNVRRGSSAALQELVGRHPNEVPHGIALVQAVDFVAVGLRRRAMIEVATRAMALDMLYWNALVDGLLGWRGLNASDAASREYAAQMLVERTIEKDICIQQHMVDKLVMQLRRCQPQDVEQQHGLVMSFALWLQQSAHEKSPTPTDAEHGLHVSQLWTMLREKRVFDNAFALRALRTNLTLALVKFVTASLEHANRVANSGNMKEFFDATLASLVERFLTRSEDALLTETPNLISSLRCLDSAIHIQCTQPAVLASQLAADITKPVLHGAGRAFALASLLEYTSSPNDRMLLLQTLGNICSSPQVDWRVVGLKAVRVAIAAGIRQHKLERDDVQMVTDMICRGLRDYTIDERGDIGSHVRLQALDCAAFLLSEPIFQLFKDDLQSLHAEILRLSLEKLNRVRIKAVECRGYITAVPWHGDVESESYFSYALTPIWSEDTSAWVRIALLEGATSCAGAGAEHLLQTSRTVIGKALSSVSIDVLQLVMEDFTTVVKTSVTSSTNVLPTLELLAYLLQARILQRLASTNYKFRNLLAFVQQAHYKSTDIPRLLSAISIYSCLADIQSIRGDVLRKLCSMLKTIPFPRVRSTVADALFMATQDNAMRNQDWTKAASQNADVLAAVRKRHDI